MGFGAGQGVAPRSKDQFQFAGCCRGTGGRPGGSCAKIPYSLKKTLPPWGLGRTGAPEEKNQSHVGTFWLEGNLGPEGRPAARLSASSGLVRLTRKLGDFRRPALALNHLAEG